MTTEPTQPFDDAGDGTDAADSADAPDVVERDGGADMGRDRAHATDGHLASSKDPEPGDGGRPRGRRGNDPAGVGDEAGAGYAAATGAVDPRGIGDDDVEAAAAAWVAKDHVRAWLRLAPALREVDLRPYFAYARDRLVPGTGAATLSADLQLLLTRLQADAKQIRDQAGRQVADLASGDRQRLIETLLDAVVKLPSGPAFRGALDLLEHSDEALEPVTAALMRLPTAAVPAREVANALARLQGRGEHADAVVDRWANGDSPQLAAAVATLRGVDRPRPRGGRGS